MAKINMNAFTFSGDVLRAVAELVFDDIIKGPALSAYHTIYPNVVTDKEIGFIRGGGLVGKEVAPCGEQDAHAYEASTRKVVFSPKGWEVFLALCYQDLQSSCAVYSLREGVDIADFKDTDYMTIFTEALSGALNQFVYRWAWFNDTEAKNIAEGGEIKNGIDVDYFNLIDGFFKQLDARIAAEPRQHVDISENDAAAYADQEVTPDKAFAYLKDAYRKASPILRGMPSKMILVTGGIYIAYQEYLSDKSIESTYANLVNGMQTLTFQGIPVIPMYIWDELIASYYDTGAKLIKPNRLVFTAPEVLAVGVDNAEAFDEIRSWYDENTKQVKVRAMGQGDAKLANDELVVYGV